jgi:hypothetical protein
MTSVLHFFKLLALRLPAYGDEHVVHNSVGLDFGNQVIQTHHLIRAVLGFRAALLRLEDHDRPFPPDDQRKFRLPTDGPCGYAGVFP